MSVATSVASASRLLEKYGEPVALTYVTGRVVDEATGTVTNAGTTVTINASGYPGRYMANEVNGTSILSGDIRLTLEKISTRPEVGWNALVDGSTYRVMDVRPVRKTAADIIYVCSLRSQ